MLEVNYKKISKYIEKAKYWQFFMCSWVLSYCMFNFGYNIRYEPLGIYAYQPFTLIILSITYLFAEVAYYSVKIPGLEKTFINVLLFSCKIIIKFIIVVFLFKEVWKFLLLKGIDITFLLGFSI
ncbi:hypothetical protein [uncultured Phascolarctobacterium sp.]|jgi:hypothetical protein|uniref:hypothetical protein n=1 Tax=uncultured Phascolarctobacterium sp. TaxID=512296 RepID=UPI0025D2504C|nr:hypothetical protein [uncultured Phascolarctobacterium sp.]